MLINFARGHPNSSLLPIDAMKEALELMRQQGNLASCLPYPSQDQDNGNSRFLQQLSLFLDHHTENDSHGDDKELSLSFSNQHSRFEYCSNTFFATHGVSHAIELLCATLTQPGDVVGIEVPTYFLVGRIFENHGLRLQPMPMKDFRLDVETMEEMLVDGRLSIPRLLYTIPTNHNPTASTLPAKDRIQLAHLAEKYGFIVIADEVYHLLDWSTNRPARMAKFNSKNVCSMEPLNNHGEVRRGCCVSVSSFTKIFCPGVRCGWIEAPLWVVMALKNYGYIQSQGGCVPFLGELMRLVLESGLATKVLVKLQAAYQQRAALLCQALTEEEIQVCISPHGGYFLWIELPVDNVLDFSQYCLERGVKFLPGVHCDHFKGNQCAPYGRLCFADLPLSDLEKGARKLGALLREYQPRDEPEQR